MMYDLPTSLEIDGVDHPIRSDYRAALDICVALSDQELTDAERAAALLMVLYEDLESITNYEEAVKQGLWFISCGASDKSSRPAPKLMDWEQDFQYIVAPINRVAGCGDIRALEYMHWWTFIGYYYEIGDCTFANIVSIRSKLAKHKKLDDHEKVFYRENREMIDLKGVGVTDDEKDLIKGIMGK